MYPFSVTERTLCYFAAFLAEKGLAPQTIQCYLLALRNAQLSMGLPDPRDQSSLLLLKRVQTGIKRVRASRGVHHQKIRLPITLTMLESIRKVLNK